MSRNKREGEYMGKQLRGHKRGLSIWLRMERRIENREDVTIIAPILSLKQKVKFGAISISSRGHWIFPPIKQPLPKKLIDTLNRALAPHKFMIDSNKPTTPGVGFSN